MKRIILALLLAPSLANATPLDSAFKTVATELHAPKCSAHVVYSDELVASVCRAHAPLDHGRRLGASSCYVHSTNTIIMPEECRENPDNWCKQKALHEAGWATFKCMGAKVNYTGQPKEVLDLEDLP